MSFYLCPTFPVALPQFHRLFWFNHPLYLTRDVFPIYFHPTERWVTQSMKQFANGLVPFLRLQPQAQAHFEELRRTIVELNLFS